MNFTKKSIPAWALAMTMTAASLSVQAEPLLRIFELGIAPGQQQAFNQAGQANLSGSVGHELGTLAMYAASPQDNPDLAYLFEVYASPEAYRVHVESQPYQTYAAVAPTLLTAHRKLTETEARFFAEKPTPIRVLNPAARPVLTFAELHLKPGTERAFAAIAIEGMKQAITQEAGVLALYAASQKGDPDTWYFVEVYADEAAYQAHQQTLHFQAYLQQATELVAETKHTLMNNRVLLNQGGLWFEKLQSPSN